jgi:hypothetical protein
MAVWLCVIYQRPDKSGRQKSSSGRSLEPLAPTIAELQAAGATSLRPIAAGLNERGIPTDLVRDAGYARAARAPAKLNGLLTHASTVVMI